MFTEFQQQRTRTPRKTKLVATIGPASRSPAMLEELIKAGVNVFRLNFSHGSYAEHSAVFHDIRLISARLALPIAILQDLSGPKIRISQVEGDSTLINDNDLIDLCFSDGSKSTAQAIRVESVDPVKTLKTGHHVLLSDGMIELQALEITPDAVKCRIIKGGKLRSRVGIAFPDSLIDLPATTAKDLRDLEWGMEHGVDYVALSFVKNAQDVLLLRDTIHSKGKDIAIIAKIERKTALDNIFEIIDVSDGLMVARGDLGLELPLEQLPLLQKRLIEQSNSRGIPVIVATQMLSSMVTSIRPTRAEVSDVANAVMSGTDALMLSEETAIGEHPVECVKYLGRIAQEAEQSFAFEEYKLRLRDSDRATVPDAVAYAACAAAIKVQASAIVACTETGNSARLVAKYRPQQPLYGASASERTLRRMALNWGVIPIPFKHSANTHDDEITTALRAVQLKEGLPNGSRAVVTGGAAVRTPGATSILEIREMRQGGSTL